MQVPNKNPYDVTDRIRFKQGEYIEILGQVLDDKNQPVNLGDYTIQSQAGSDIDKAVINFTVTKKTPHSDGYFILEADSNVLEIGLLSFDIAFILDGKPKLSRSVYLEIIEADTHVINIA
jgi:hypothetical protein